MKFQKVKEGRVQCTICPRYCTLKAGQRGFCYVRGNVEGEIKLLTYGRNTGLCVDPIEKKPLYHFLEGSKTLSFGTLGCNMGCLFCQNSHITKVKGNIEECPEVSPEEIVKLALQYDCKSVAFTYNDPVIFFEYALDTARLCHRAGLKTVAVTSGYINPAPRAEFFKEMDAINIDLKGFSEKFYSKNCLAHIAPVLDTIKYAANETKCHIELTTLLIEGENTDAGMLEAECDWIVQNVGCDVPLHFSRFFPRYKFLNYPPTSLGVMRLAQNIAKAKGIKYVYLGNV